MKVGDKLDPLELGHTAIDVKTMMRDAGYNVPQVSAAKIGTIPDDVQAAVKDIQQRQKRYFYMGKVVEFACPFCGEKISTSWRRDEVDGTEFLVCANCNVVVEVR